MISQPIPPLIDFFKHIKAPQNEDTQEQAPGYGPGLPIKRNKDYPLIAVIAITLLAVIIWNGYFFMLPLLLKSGLEGLQHNLYALVLYTEALYKSVPLCYECIRPHEAAFPGDELRQSLL